MDPDPLLDSLIPVGWKLGLERMNLLCDLLGRPQDRYDTIHVVGTNGKTSVTRMTAALAEAHGRRTGVLISPHLHHWSERVLIGGQEVDPEFFGEAVERAVHAANRVNCRLGSGDQVTRFELATAAGFLALAASEVELAVVEAGLGGRLDATNTIRSKITVLTSVGLDHTEFLGESEAEIAAEKLAVLRPGTVLVTGPLDPDIADQARAAAAEAGADLIEVGPEDEDQPEIGPGPVGFQRRNLAVAMAAARAWLGNLDPDRTAAAIRNLAVPGRLELLADDPPTWGDVAHNRPGAAALAGSLPAVAAGRPVIGCIAILTDKDAAGMLEELAPTLDYAVFTTLPAAAVAARGRPGTKAYDPVELAALATAAGLAGETVAEPAAAFARARELAGERGGVALVTGSHLLLGEVS